MANEISGPANDQRPNFFLKCSKLKQPYCFIKVKWSEKFHEIVRDTIILLSYQVNEAFPCTKVLYEKRKLREVSVSKFFLLIITLMLSRIVSDCTYKMSVSNKHNYKTFTKSPPSSSLHCIENILNHSSGKCHDSLTMAALRFTKSTDLCTIFIHLA